MSWIWHLTIWWLGSSNAGALGNAVYPFITTAPCLLCVAYWPPTRPSCQDKKCTCVNNWYIRSKISDQGWPWLSRDWIKCELWRSHYITPRQEVQISSREPCPSRGWAPRPPFEQPRRTGNKRCYDQKSGDQYVTVLFSLQRTSLTIIPFVTLSNLASAYEYATLWPRVIRVIRPDNPIYGLNRPKLSNSTKLNYLKKNCFYI